MAEYMGELLLASATAAVINILLLFLRRAVADRPITGEPSLACVRSAEACGRPMRAGVPAEGNWPRGKKIRKWVSNAMMQNLTGTKRVSHLAGNLA